MRSRFSLAPPRGSIRFKQAQVPSAPLSLASLRVVLHSWSGGTPSPSRASPAVRLAIGPLLAVPATRARYDASISLAHIGVPSEWWRVAFAMFGAITVGGIAWARMSILTEPALRGGVAAGPAQPPIGATAQGLVTLWVYRRPVGISVDTRPSSMTVTSRSSRTSIEPGRTLRQTATPWPRASALASVRSSNKGPPFCTPGLLFLRLELRGLLCGPIDSGHVSCCSAHANTWPLIGLIWPKSGYASIA